MIDGPDPTADPSPWPIRSLLYVPATRSDWVIKAINAEVEAVILDLEDAVGPNEKQAARALTPQGIEMLRTHGVSAFVRPNEFSAGGIDDIHACARPGLTGIVLPKASVESARRAHDALSYAEGKAGLRHGEICILALPETSEGIRTAYDIAKASPRVRGLMSGVGVLEGDLARSCGFRPTFEGDEQLYLQSKVVLDSRAAGAHYPLAAVFSPRLDDLGSLEIFARRAKQLGFTGGAVIHPSHVRTINATFRATEQEVAHYESLIEAMEEAHRNGSGAVQYKGTMIDMAMLAFARKVVGEARRRRAR